MPAPGPAEVCQLRCSGRGEQSGPAAPPARGSRGVLRVRRAGELPQGHCSAQCSEAAPNSILPSGPCYDELVAPLYSYSIGASSRYNIFYSASFARLHSESVPPRSWDAGGAGEVGRGCPWPDFASGGFEGSNRELWWGRASSPRSVGSRAAELLPPQAPAAGPPTPGTSSPGSRST